MGAMWAERLPGYTQVNYDADIRESASVAHLYGKKLVAGEMFGAFCPGAPIGALPFNYSPARLKPFADRAMAMGLNRFVIANSDHQPREMEGPGLGLSVFGQWFTRKETWAEQAGPWMLYLARSSHLLQQGRFVADIAYFYGEDTNATSVFNTKAVPAPPGYAFDFVNAGALLSELEVSGGKLVSRSGMRYSVLVLDQGIERLSLPVLRKIEEYVAGGLTVIGPQPNGSPSLADSQNDVARIIATLWGDEANSPRIAATNQWSKALHHSSLRPDVDFGPTGDGMRFVHREVEGCHLYFVSNGTGTRYRGRVLFRMPGMKPEIWRADRGTFETPSYRQLTGSTDVALEIEADESVFVVFGTTAQVAEFHAGQQSTLPAVALDGAWSVTFPDGGMSRSRVFDQLASWSEHADDAVRHFSGTAVYRKTWTWDLRPERDERFCLDLGNVLELAEVTLNGVELGVLWRKPFCIDVTSALRSGANELEIRVTNLWVNRLVGDRRSQAPSAAYAAHNPFRAEDALLQSGLLGPVKILRSSQKSPHEDKE
jgi:hypothetical protein